MARATRMIEFLNTHRIVLGILVVFICGALCAAAFSALRWHRDYHMGVVFELTDQGFILEQFDRSKVTVHVDQLSIREGRSLAPGELAPGMDVMVIGNMTGDGSITAQVVRIVDVHNKKPRRP